MIATIILIALLPYGIWLFAENRQKATEIERLRFDLWKHINNENELRNCLSILQRERKKQESAQNILKFEPRPVYAKTAQ